MTCNSSCGSTIHVFLTCSRVITTSQRDGTLPLINSDVLCPTNEQQRQHSNTVALQKSRGKSRSVTTAPVAMALPAQTEPSNSIVTTSPHGPSNNAPASKVPGHDVSSHLPTPPSRLGNISLHRWSTMYSNRCYDRDRKTETAVSEVTTGGKMSAVNNKLENKGVDKQQELLLLRSCCRSYPNRLAKITHRKARRFTADSASHHYHVTDHVTGHMTGMYSDVTPPPSPPYVGLGMSVRKYACTI